MYCENCGVYVRDGETICPECRKPIRQNTANQNVPPVNMGNPGTVQKPQPVTPKPQQSSGALTGALVGLIVVLAVVLLGLGLVAGGVNHIGVGDEATAAEKTGDTSSSSSSSSSSQDSGNKDTETTSSSSTNNSSSSNSSSSNTSSGSNSTSSSSSNNSSSSGNETNTYTEPAPQPEPTPAPAPAPAAGGTGSASTSSSGAIDWYVIPDSSSRSYAASELYGYSNWDLFIARNEIYARHGRGFKFQNLRDYFNRCTWYTERYDADTFDAYHSGELSDLEMNNIYTILDVEKGKGSPYPYGTGYETPW